MNRYRRIYSIIKKEFLESFKNKTVLIVILLPVLASLLFSIVGSNEIDKVFNIAVVEEESAFSIFLNDVDNIQVRSFQDVDEGIQLLKSGQIDGLIRNDGGFTVYLDSSQSLTYFFLKDNLENLIEIYLNKTPDLNIEFVPLNSTISSLSFLPVWITITVTMIGVLIISGSFAEEKENKTLYSIIISPASKFDILVGKGIFGVLFTFITISIMCFLNGVFSIGFINIIKLSTAIIVASVSFTSIGLLIGSFTDTQSTARSVGTIIYFPLLFPTLIADLSNFTRVFAKLFPTYYLFSIIEKLLIYQGEILILTDLFFLTLMSIVLSIITFMKFRKVN